MTTSGDHIAVRWHDGVAVVALTRADVTDPAYLTCVTNETREVIAQRTPPRLVFDFSCVHFIGSSGLGALVVLLREVEEAGGRLAVAAVRDEVQIVFRLSRLDRVIPIVETVEAAVAGMDAG